MSFANRYGKSVTLRGNAPLFVLLASAQFIIVSLWLYSVLISFTEDEAQPDQGAFTEIMKRNDPRLFADVRGGFIVHSKPPRLDPTSGYLSVALKERKESSVMLSTEPVSSKVLRGASSRTLRIYSRLISSTKGWRKQFGYSGEVMAFDCLKDALVELGHVLVESTLPAPHKTHTPARRRMAMRAYEPLCKDHWDVLLVEYNRIDEAWSHNCVRSSGVRLAVLDFYGHTAAHVHPLLTTRNYLTMYPEKMNTFLGFFIRPGPPEVAKDRRDASGVIWGKRKEYFTPAVIKVLNDVLAAFPDLKLHATVANKKGLPIQVQGLTSPRVKYHGMMKHEDFVNMLRHSRFVMGLGHPLYGPTAMEALSLGCRYFNFIHEQVFQHPMGTNFTSQHDYLGQLAKSHPNLICNFDVYKHPASLHVCIRQVLSATKFEPFVPDDYQWKNFLKRTDKVFDAVLNTTILHKQNTTTIKKL